MPRPLNVAVVGVGYLGRFHAQKYAALPQCRLVGVVDTDPRRAETVARELGVTAYTALDALLPQVDALSIVVPTGLHHQVGLVCLRAGKHLLLEKPVTATAAEAEELVALARTQGLVVQVGHLERFNPAFLACRPRIEQPQFIEAIRISSFLGRGVDVDVVLDLMSHDLDLVLSLVRSPLRDLHAVGVSLVTPRTDLANVRLMFENGCVANLTASRISTKAERTMRLFQRNRYMALDFAKPAARIYGQEQGAPPPPPVRYREEHPALTKGDALLAEIASFVETVGRGGTPVVTGEDGLRVVAVAERIIGQIARNPLP
ncbi:MAG: Gfo/Idh/MocA family oxidoreductase [Candidatus Lambdaproteobacteria bacterium]|nr:Gfo/Idh/MocA family oxidoreductase [Candidatus Lambdaproteobacteria bacterium]